MKTNEANQQMSGGVPTTQLTVSDIVTYYGAIVASNSEGDLAVWDGYSSVIQVFNNKNSGIYEYSEEITSDCRLSEMSLEDVAEEAKELLG